jgi:hypothetical protein
MAAFEPATSARRALRSEMQRIVRPMCRPKEKDLVTRSGKASIRSAVGLRAKRVPRDQSPRHNSFRRRQGRNATRKAIIGTDMVQR